MNLAPQLEQRLHDLPGRRRQVVEDSLNGLAQELLEGELATASLAKVEAAGRVAIDALEVLMTASPELLERVGQALADMRAEIDAEETDPDALAAGGRLQVVELFRRIEAESLTVAQLEAAGIQRQRLKQLRDQDRLLGIELPFRRGFLYPQWQFGDDLRPRSELPDLLAAAREAGLDAITVHRAMTRPEAGDGATLLELCARGRLDLALNALRTFGELGG